MVKDTIDQFMWAFQRHFRIGVAYEIEAALSRIGLEELEVRVVLVGFALSETARHQVCIEPEDGPLSTGHLSAVADRTSELFREDPESQVIYTSPMHGEQRYTALFLRSRAAALEEAIEAAGVFDGFTFFASNSTPIGGYQVYTCAGVPTSTLEGLPALDGPWVDRIYVGRSLQHEVVAESLRRADRALYFPNPGGGGLRDLGPTEEVVQSAAVLFTDGLVYRAGGVHTNLFHALNAFTSLRYERAGASGHLVAANHRKAAEWTRVRFKKQVSLHNSRIIRKLLELSGESASLVTDGSQAYGLGTWEPGPDVAEITIRGHAEWELTVDGSAFMRVAYGHPKLPHPPLDPSKFADAAQRTLGVVDTDFIWATIQASQRSGHGMMLVVSNSPEAETARLGKQAMPIDAARLDPADIARLGLVDGAVLFGPDGRCHAFGVILDGAATDHGDPARGSRYNSAVRYHKEHRDSLLVVISDDRTVDLIPSLRPKLHQAEVQAAVNAFCETCEAEPVDGEMFALTHRRVEKLAFYLDADQCQRVNDAREAEMRRRLEAGGSLPIGRRSGLTPTWTTPTSTNTYPMCVSRPVENCAVSWGLVSG